MKSLPQLNEAGRQIGVCRLTDTHTDRQIDRNDRQVVRYSGRQTDKKIDR